MLVPHGTFLTREKTEAEQQFMPCGMLGGKKAKKDTLVRRAYLQLDLLKPGDVFVSGRYSSLLSVGVLWRWWGCVIIGNVLVIVRVADRYSRVETMVDFPEKSNLRQTGAMPIQYW